MVAFTLELGTNRCNSPLQFIGINGTLGCKVNFKLCLVKSAWLLVHSLILLSELCLVKCSTVSAFCLCD